MLRPSSETAILKRINANSLSGHKAEQPSALLQGCLGRVLCKMRVRSSSRSATRKRHINSNAEIQRPALQAKCWLINSLSSSHARLLILQVRTDVENAARLLQTCHELLPWKVELGKGACRFQAQLIARSASNVDVLFVC